MAVVEAMGWTNVTYIEEIHSFPFGEPPKPKEQRYGDYRDFERVPNYSEDGSAMLELIAELKKCGYNVTVTSWDYLNNKPGVIATILKPDSEIDGGCGYADTMPQAVALAAHKALIRERG